MSLIGIFVVMVDHDRLFKELLSTFFIEFLELFLPELAEQIDPTSIQFLQQEYFADLTSGEEKIVDLLVEVQQLGATAAFLIHLEAQSFSEANFARRIFFYFSILHQRYLQRIYPIVVFSFDKPDRQESNRYTVKFGDRTILDFNFEAIQLNRLNWRDYLNQQNPVAAALMAKMRIETNDRPKVKAECLRLLATLRLDPVRTRLISGFVDTYLRLNTQEEQVFQSEVGKLETSEQEQIMQITTTWMEQGIEQGITQGIMQGERSIVLRLLTRRVGELPEGIRSQVELFSLHEIEALGEALLDFTNLSDLEQWLIQQT